jgi:hypothetical protein
MFLIPLGTKTTCFLPFLTRNLSPTPETVKTQDDFHTPEQLLNPNPSTEI